MRRDSKGIDLPRSLADPTEQAARKARLQEAHVAPLKGFVELVRVEVGPEKMVPHFDPWDGGVHAEILFLLEAPGARAIATGFISRNNPDETAKNFFELNEAAGIPRDRTITWNIVPWYIGTGEKIRAASRVDIGAGIPVLARLLEFLPKLRAIVLIGRKAEQAEESIRGLRPSIRIFRSSHPSPLFVNNAPGNRARILSVLESVAEYVGLTR